MPEIGLPSDFAVLLLGADAARELRARQAAPATCANAQWVELRPPPQPTAKASLPAPDLLSPREAAAKLHCSTKTLDGHVASGALRYVQIGQGKKRPRRMFAPSDLEAFIENQTRKESLPCLSTNSPTRHSGTSTSRFKVIAFTARQRPRTSAKPK